MSRPSVSESLLNVAIDIALRPGQWRQIVEQAIANHVISLDADWPNTKPLDAMIAGDWSAPPEPAGFLVAWLAFLHAYADRRRFQDELLYVGLTALEKPLSDTRLAQMRVELCQRLLPLTSEREHQIYVLNETGTSLADSTEGGRHDQQQQAIDFHLKALSLCDRSAMPLHYGAIQVCLGKVYKERVSGVREQNLQDAMDCYRDALKLYDDPTLCNDYTDEVRARRVDVLNNLGNAWRQRRDTTGAGLRESLNCFLRALRECDEPATRAELLRNLSLTYLRFTEQREATIKLAIGCLSDALAIYETNPAPLWEALAWLNLGLAYSQRGDGGDGPGGIGPAPQPHPEAVNAYTRAQALYRRLGIRREAMRCLANLGALYANAGDWASAAGQFDEAARLLEQELRETETQHARHVWHSLTSDIYDGLIASHTQLSEEGNLASAIEAATWCEIGRAKNLADWVSLGQQPPRGVDSEEFDAFCRGERELRDLDEQIAAAERCVAQLPEARPTLDKLRAARARRFDRQQASRRAFQQADPDWAVNTAPLSIDEQRQVAREARSALLTLRPTPWGTCAVLIAPDGAVATRLLPTLTWVDVNRMLGIGPDGAQDTAVRRGWRSDAKRLCENREAVYAAEQELQDAKAKPSAAGPDNDAADEDSSRKLLALLKAEACLYEAELDWHETLEAFPRELGEKVWLPLREWLHEHYPRAEESQPPRSLIVLPGWGFNALPLHAANWREPGDEATHWACDAYCFSYAPSAWMLRRCLQRSAAATDERPSLVAVRNPTNDLELADWEVDVTVAEFPGRSTILGSAHHLEHPPALHDSTVEALQTHTIALVSSHGYYDAQNPWGGSGVFLAKDDDEPGLTVRRFFSIDLSRLSLAVLSACETAGVDASDATGEQLGLPSALLAAGARTVVATHWEVDDFPSALLVQRFFRELRSTEAPGDKNQALARAQRWLRRLTRREVKGLHNHACEHLRQLGEGADETTHGIDRFVRERDAAFPFEKPRYWAGFACFGVA